MFTPLDHSWMAQALRLAEHGLYTTSPNPRVGCVIVAQDQCIGSGWHQRAGEPHAEVNAIKIAGNRAQGATAYVTLEPCSHHGRTPPCSDALIKAGVSRVVVAMSDPNPLVAGTGIAKLRAAGITTDVGLMETESRSLNHGFIKRMRHQLPWVRSKFGMSIDGRSALKNGTSKWITSNPARLDVQSWRARSCAVLTGINTVLADEAQLNVRHIQTSRQPLRVILDTHLRLPSNTPILNGGNVLIFTCMAKDSLQSKQLEQAGATICQLAGSSLDLKQVLTNLARRGCNEVLVEAGATLNGNLLKAGLVDELILYIAPQLLGDMGRGIASLGELTKLNQKINLHWQDCRQVGPDLRIIARVGSAPYLP